MLISMDVLESGKLKKKLEINREYDLLNRSNSI